MKEKNIITGLRGIYGFQENDDALFFRGLNSIVSFGQENLDFHWQYTFQDDYIFGYKSIFLSKDLLVTFYRKDNSKDNVTIIGHKAKTGEKIWEYKTSWKKNENFGGAILWNSFIIFFEKNPISRINFLDIQTGLLKKQISISKTFCHSSQFQNQAKTCISLNNYLIAATDSGLLILNLENDSIKMMFQNHSIKTIENLGSKLFIVLNKESGQELHCIDRIDKTMNWSITYPLNYSIIDLMTDDKKLILVKFNNNLGIQIINGLTGELVKKVGEYQWIVYDASLLNGGNSVIVPAIEEDTPVWVFDKKVSDKPSVILLEDDILRGRLFKSKNRIFFSCSEGTMWYQIDKLLSSNL